MQQMGSSGLMALPAEADFDTPIAAEIERYMSTESATARERAKLFYLAWGRGLQRLRRAARSCTSDSSVATPVRNDMMLYNNHNEEPSNARVQEFLDWSG